MAKKKITAAELSALLSLYGEKATAAAKMALDKGADEVIEDAKYRCPVLTGRLRDSIHKETENGGLKIKIVADAQNDYGAYYGKVVEFSPQINLPFLYPAIDAKREAIRKNVADAIHNSSK